MAPVTKLGIGMATAGLMEARTAFSLISALLHTRVPALGLYLGIGCYIHQNRDTVVRQALDEQCSHLLFVDTDMMFPREGINRLVEAGKDIIGANYNKKIQPQVPIVTQPMTGLTQVPFVPTGFMLIDCRVFAAIGKPYFSFSETIHADDEFFCDKAQRNGFEVWCDPTIQCGHLGTAVF